jgi:hydroxymethylpyrimidine pyrophosphatase-like HAD family hydrolase
MRWRALATDYDGTLAHDGTVPPAVWSALEQAHAAGLRLLLVTGRVLPELQQVCDRLELFEHVVIENGAALYDPHRQRQKVLAEPPPPSFVHALHQRGVRPIVTGTVIVATFQPHQETVREVIAESGLPLDIIMNKDAVMVLPRGVDKAFGLHHLLPQLGLAPQEVIGVGDAENDRTFLELCGLRVAVANALPEVQAAVHWTTPSPRGAGVCELLQRWQLGDLDSLLSRQ